MEVKVGKIEEDRRPLVLYQRSFCVRFIVLWFWYSYINKETKYLWKGDMAMEKIYFTIAGTKHHYGQEYFEPKMEVKLVKEPDNEFDKEAIKVEMDGLGLVGYVANSPFTVQGESMSAGRLYDRIGDTATGIVKYVLPQGILCELSEKKNY